MRSILLTLSLLVAHILVAKSQDPGFRPTYNYSGYIQTSNTQQVEIKLNFLVLSDSSIVGSYYYNAINGRLKLSGKVSTDHKLIFDEWDEKGRNTGRFDGKLSTDRNVADGIWTSGDGKRKFPFELKLNKEMRSFWDYIKRNRALKEYHDIDLAIRNANKVLSVDVASQGHKTLPPNFAKLQNLLSVNLLGNNFERFPSVLAQLEQLEEASFASNNMKYIGPEIGKLRNLRILILDFNSLTSLPDEIGNLSNLLYLDLSTNKNLKTLPPTMANLKKLQELNLGRTLISKEEIARMRKLLPNCVIVAN